MTAVQSLEQEFAAQMGAQGAVATGYGRGAMLLALEVSGVRGADVAVPNFICSQVPEAVGRAGGRVAFYPVRLNCTIDAQEFANSLTPQTRAAIVAHYFGAPHQNIAALAEICRRRGVALIEDCALALGAGAGTTGDLAVYSFTKADWCYGGGMVTTSVRDWLPRLREIRRERLVSNERMARRYGWLRRADFEANRPSRASIAEFAGRQMQSWFSRKDPTLRDANFYDAAPFDALMPEFAARRTLEILRGMRAATARRMALWDGISDRMSAEPREPLLVPHSFGVGAECSTGNHAFLGLTLRNDLPLRLTAEQVVARAARRGVTLRRTWPAYQELAAGQDSKDLRWLAERLLILEVHPVLTKREVGRIVETLWAVEQK